MAKLHSLLHSTFQDLSNNTSHAQFRVKMKKLWPQQVEEENQAAEQKLCHDISRFCHDKASEKARNFVATNPDYVATKLEDKLCRDKVKAKPKTNFVTTKFFFCCNKYFFVATKLFCCNKGFLLQQRIFCCNKEFSVVTKISLSQQSFSIATKNFLLQQRIFCHNKVCLTLSRLKNVDDSKMLMS